MKPEYHLTKQKTFTRASTYGQIIRVCSPCTWCYFATALDRPRPTFKQDSYCTWLKRKMPLPTCGWQTIHQWRIRQRWQISNLRQGGYGSGWPLRWQVRNYADILCHLRQVLDCIKRMHESPGHLEQAWSCWLKLLAPRLLLVLFLFC